jgi:hypothetical protein
VLVRLSVRFVGLIIVSSLDLALPLILIISGLVDLASLIVAVPEFLGHALGDEAVVLRVTLLSEGVSTYKELVILPQDVPDGDIGAVDSPEWADFRHHTGVEVGLSGIGMGEV